MKNTKFLFLFLALLMLVSLTACGKDNSENTETGPVVLEVGDFELIYKGASMMKDYDGNDALVLTLDFINNSKETTNYFWSIYETAVQNNTELEMAIVYLNVDTMDTVDNSQHNDVAPGDTLEIQTAFELNDTTGEVEVTFEEMIGNKNDSITIDLSTLSQESAESGTETLTGGKTAGSNGEADVFNGDQLRDWWNGEWYGWWVMTGCWGDYEDMEGQWWDICGTIDIGEDGMGTVTLWDVDYMKSEPMVSASVSLNEAGTSEYGTMMSEGGWFMSIPLEHSDWIVDPGLLDYPNMIHIDGNYENGEDEFFYDIYLRPWGTYWDDVTEEDLPYYYSDWYLPLIEAGESMPDSIGVGL